MSKNFRQLCCRKIFGNCIPVDTNVNEDLLY